VVSRLYQLAFTPINIAPLVYLRISFGVIMLWEVYRYFDNGWIRPFYINKKVFFTYYGFDWVTPLPGDGMYMLFYFMGMLAVCIAVGLAYRAAIILFFFCFSYVFLLDQTYYLNHFYLLILVCFLMCWIPANGAFSVDALLRPSIRTRTAPAWMLRLIQFQIAIPYFYGALAKLNGDWLQGEPMRMWLAEETNFPLIGQYFTQEWMVAGFVYGGILVDALALPLFWWRRTRLLGLLMLLSFHFLNGSMFNIGIFPWFMSAALPLFLPLSWWDRLFPIESQAAANPLLKQRVALGLVGVYVAWQLLFPLRHFLLPGDVSWTEEGHRFAWHMKLRDKAGSASFRVYDPVTDESWAIALEDYLSVRQRREIGGQPEMILLFSHHLSKEWREKGYERVEVYVDAFSSLNGRPYRRIVDSSVNFAALPRALPPADWILPLEQKAEVVQTR
jgi:vitamin K-dependent gamma-carboxylase